MVCSSRIKPSFDGRAGAFGTANFRRLLFILGLGAGLMCAIGLAILGALAFGDSQWGYLVYRFQADVYPGREPPVPSGFTGVWRTWWRCGALKEKVDVVNGIRNGAYTSYHEEGPPSATGRYANGKEDGLWVFRDSSGRKEQQCPFRNGLPHGQVLKWDESGKRHAEWSWDGHPVTEEEFNRRAKAETARVPGSLLDS